MDAAVERLNPADAMALAASLYDARRFGEAANLYEAAWRADPGDHLAAHMTGLALSQDQRHDKALPWFDRAAAALRDELVAVACNRGGALGELGRSEEALTLFNGMARASPNNPLVHYNRGLVLMQMGQYDEAIRDFDIALDLDPRDDKARFGRGFARLVLGDYVKGFEDYEHRLKDDIDDPDAELWTGQQELAGKTILIYGEMGFGDSIMFLRYVPILQDAGARVLLAMPPAIRPWAAMIHGVAVLDDDRSKWPPFDYWIRAMSLAWACETGPGNVPPPVFIKADGVEIAKWRKLTEGRGELRVGLCWTGSTRSKYDNHRSVALADLAALFDVPGCRFFSLQKDVRDSDREAFEALPIVDLAKDFVSFRDTFHAMKALDLVITVDTSVAHMAGTVGVPTWVMLSAFRTYWLWIQKRKDSPWYPSVSVLRQEKDGDWSGVIGTVAERLRMAVKAAA